MNYVDNYLAVVCPKCHSASAIKVDEDGVFCWFDGWRPTRDRVEPVKFALEGLRKREPRSDKDA